MLKLFANFPQELFPRNRNSPSRDRTAIVNAILNIATHCAVHTVFSSRTTENVNVASVKILAPRMNAQLTANVQLTSLTNKAKLYLCRFVVSSRNPDNAHVLNNNRHNVKLNVATTLIAVETTSAVQLDVLSFARRLFKSGQQLKHLITILKIMLQAWKMFQKTSFDLSREKVVSLHCDASQPASHPLRSHGNVAELK